MPKSIPRDPTSAMSSTYRSIISASAAILLVLLAGVHGNASYAQGSTLEEQYDLTLKWLQNNTVQSKSGLILRESPKYYQSTLSLTALDGTFTSVPSSADLKAETPFRGYNVVVDSTKRCVYFSQSDDFQGAECVSVGEGIPSITKWFVTRTATSEFQFNYANVHFNTWTARSLVDMYQVTGNQDYLDRSRELLTALTNHLSDDGKWYRYRKDDEEPRYIGMVQSLLMQAIYKHAPRSEKERGA